jgi:hypothetical protein
VLAEVDAAARESPRTGLDLDRREPAQQESTCLIEADRMTAKTRSPRRGGRFADSRVGHGRSSAPR